VDRETRSFGLLLLTVLVASLGPLTTEAAAKRRQPGGKKNQPPVAYNVIAPSSCEATPATVALSYTDEEGDLATHCATSGLSNVSESSACACDAAGLCSVEVIGVADPATFQYQVTAGGKDSNLATATLDIVSVNDPPVALDFAHPAFPENTEEIIELPYTHVCGSAQSCELTDLDNVTESTPCGCSAGVCTVGVTGLQAGAASFSFTVADGALESTPADASLAIAAPGLRDLGEQDYFGFSVAASGNRIVVGAPGEDSDSIVDMSDDSLQVAGAAYVYEDANGDGDWSNDIQLQAYLKASNREAADFFGAAVAMDGNTIVVLKDTESWFPFIPNEIYVFVDETGDGDWVERNVIERPPEAGHWGGAVWTGPGFNSIAIQGNRIVVGAFQDSSSMDFSGAVYVYEKPDGDPDWSNATETRIQASDQQEGASFGLSVALDGDVLVTGAMNHHKNPKGRKSKFTGAAYVYRHDGSSWVEEAKLEAFDSSAHLHFGSRIDIDGDTIVVSAESNDEPGAVYVFRHEGGAWVPQTDYRLQASNGDPGDRFGFGGLRVSGNEIFVATPHEDGDQNEWVDSGALYIFEDPDANGDWSNAVESYLKPTELPSLDGETHDYFGCAFAVTGDTLVIGAFDEDGNGEVPPNDLLLDSGAVYLFVDPDRDGNWVEHLTLK
jgi:hypothetical protein